MRRYTDLTKKELSELSEEQRNHYIDLEIAFAGIVPVLQPQPFLQREPLLEKKDLVFNIFGDFYVKTLEDVEAISKIQIFTSKYDYYKAGYDYKFMEETEVSATPTKFYLKEDIDHQGTALKEYKDKKEAYQTEFKEYESFLKKTQDIRKEFDNAYNAAIKFYASVELARKQYARFLELTEGNKEIARNFFTDCYKNNPDIIAEVFPEPVKTDTDNED